MALNLFRKRKKETLSDGTKKVTVTDRKGRVRKQKLVKPSGIKEKQKYDKAGNIHTAKLKGPGMRKKKIDAKGLGITEIKTPGYKWADNPNKKKTTPKKTQTVLNDTKKTTNTNDTKKTTTNTNKSTTKDTKKTNGNEAYRKQRDYNKKNKIAHFGDSKGYFTHEGKQYNTESRSEKEARLKKNNPPPPPTPPANKKIDVTGDIHKGKKQNVNQYNEIDGRSTSGAKRGGSVKYKKGGRVMGIGKWAGKSVPGMRYD